jgi:hypothetical protein
MLQGLMGILKGMLSSKAMNIGGQIFQIGMLSTVWGFINSVIKTLQHNVTNIVLASIA